MERKEVKLTALSSLTLRNSFVLFAIYIAKLLITYYIRNFSRKGYQIFRSWEARSFDPKKMIGKRMPKKCTIFSRGA